MSFSLAPLLESAPTRILHILHPDYLGDVILSPHFIIQGQAYAITGSVGAPRFIAEPHFMAAYPLPGEVTVQVNIGDNLRIKGQHVIWRISLDDQQRPVLGVLKL